MSRRESDADYDQVVARSGVRWRVIVCADNLQWIIQEKRGKTWRSLWFVTSREAVLRRIEELTRVSAKAKAAIAALPPLFQGAQIEINLAGTGETQPDPPTHPPIGKAHQRRSLAIHSGAAKKAAQTRAGMKAARAEGPNPAADRPECVRPFGKAWAVVEGLGVISTHATREEAEAAFAERKVERRKW